MADTVDPNCLTQEELDEEFSVRKIRERGPLGLPLLQQAFLAEAAGAAQRPASLANTRVHQHIKTCNGIAYEIAEGVSKLASSPDTAQEHILRSRFTNLVWRLNRLSDIAQGKDKEAVESLQNQLGQIKGFVEVSQSLPTIEPPSRVGEPDADGAAGDTLPVVSSPPDTPQVSKSATVIPPLTSTGATPKRQNVTTTTTMYGAPRSNYVNGVPLTYTQAGDRRSTHWDFPPPLTSTTTYNTSREATTLQYRPIALSQSMPSFQSPTPGHQQSQPLISVTSNLHGPTPAFGVPERDPQHYSYVPDRTHLHQQSTVPTDAGYVYEPMGPQHFNINLPAAYNQQQVGYPPAPAPVQHGVPYHPPGRPGSIHLMSKWSLKYRGTSSGIPIDDFLFRVETLARSLDIDLNRLAMGMPFILEGEAQEWFWIYQREYPNADWQAFKGAMSHQFSKVENQFEIWDQIRSRKQKETETFGQFYIAVAALAARLRPPLEQARMIELLRANMHVGLRTALLYQPSYSLRHLHDAAMQYEKLKNGIIDNQRTVRPPQRNINELSYSEPNQAYRYPDTANTPRDPEVPYNLFPPREAVEAISTPKRVDDLICWNCDEQGHTFFDCTVATKNVFCYGCGAKNTYRPNCARCRPGNSRQGVVTASTSRPNQQAMPNRAPNPFAKQ